MGDDAARNSSPSNRSPTCAGHLDSSDDGLQSSRRKVSKRKKKKPTKPLSSEASSSDNDAAQEPEPQPSTSGQATEPQPSTSGMQAAVFRYYRNDDSDVDDVADLQHVAPTSDSEVERMMVLEDDDYQKDPLSTDSGEDYNDEQEPACSSDSGRASQNSNDFEDDEDDDISMIQLPDDANIILQTNDGSELSDHEFPPDEENDDNSSENVTAGSADEEVCLLLNIYSCKIISFYISLVCYRLTTISFKRSSWQHARLQAQLHCRKYGIS